MNTNTPKATFNICASCPARDTFSMHQHETGYKVLQCTNGFSPLLINEPPIPFDKERFDAFELIGISNYAKRCLKQSLERSNVDWALQQKADYMIVDSGLFRVTMQYLGKKQDECLHWTINPQYADKMKHEGIIPSSVGTKKPEDYSDEEIKHRIKRYLDRFLEHYRQDEIILMDIRHASVYVETDGSVKPFFRQRWGVENRRIARAFEIMKDYLKDCHLIPMPDFVLGNKKHPLGHHAMHYTQEYYDYALACLDVICQKLPHAQEKEKIAALCQKCSDECGRKYSAKAAASLVKSAQELNKTAEHRDKFELYLDFFQKLMEKNTPLETFFFAKNIRSVIFYGWTKYSKILVKALEKRGITVKCIVENGNVHYGDVPFLPRSAVQFPEADAILIADLMNKETIRAKLEKLTKIPVYDDDDLLSL